MRYGFIHTTLGLENTSEQLIDDSNNISTRKAFQQNKESINTIHDKIDKENVTDLTHLDIPSTINPALLRGTFDVVRLS